MVYCALPDISEWHNSVHDIRFHVDTSGFKHISANTGQHRGGGGAGEGTRAPPNAALVLRELQMTGATSTATAE
eukprot:4111541-Pyramimonas_sp.AAC.1